MSGRAFDAARSSRRPVWLGRPGTAYRDQPDHHVGWARAQGLAPPGKCPGVGAGRAAGLDSGEGAASPG